jgi:stress-induced morphogen
LLTIPTERKPPPMAMDANEIKALILEALPDADVRIEDLRGDGDHYAAYVTSASFAGKSRVQQHQMVYAALKGKMGGELHALALQTLIPAKR